MKWAAKYIGLPWRSGASGPDAYDCWGLVRAVYRERLGIDLPAVDVDAHRAIACAHEFARNEERARWLRVDAPEPLDAALLGLGDRPIHVGVWTGEGVLHAIEGSGVVHQMLGSLAVHGWRVLGWYRRRA